MARKFSQKGFDAIQKQIVRERIKMVPQLMTHLRSIERELFSPTRLAKASVPELTNLLTAVQQAAREEIKAVARAPQIKEGAKASVSKPPKPRRRKATHLRLITKSRPSKDNDY
jgi:tRNA U34 5-methylaminomethyl-2-thiouridine-forming methyltransferase MnmC